MDINSPHLLNAGQAGAVSDPLIVNKSGGDRFLVGKFPNYLDTVLIISIKNINMKSLIYLLSKGMQQHCCISQHN